MISRSAAVLDKDDKTQWAIYGYDITVRSGNK